MSLHKLTAGTGYDYLTRQVAAFDSTEKGHSSLASYYAEKGETPGVWTGSGLAGIDGLAAGDVVTAEQMHALFGLGLHPLAGAQFADRTTGELSLEVVDRSARLGTPFPAAEHQVTAFQIEVARRVAAASVAAGGTTRGAVDIGVRAKVRSEVAREFFRAEYGREPSGERELAGAVARYARTSTNTVAGFDLTFSPVKSVSALWAVADPAVAAQVELAHNAAVAEALEFIEKEALFTRLGAGGVRQVEVRGLVATAFTHRDSRAGDPDLHTHVAVANKVQTLDGQWRAIDGRVLYKAAVTASEVYNTAIEKHLSARLSVRFIAREQTRADIRPVREIDGIAPKLLTRWSSRRAAIEERRGDLAARFQADHGRPPSPVEALHLAQQATLETRDAKHEPRSLIEQRNVWAREASEVLGGATEVSEMVAAALNPLSPAPAAVDAAWVRATAAQVIAAMEARRATWQVWHVKAEAVRRARYANLAPEQVAHVISLVVDEALTRHSIALTKPESGVQEPRVLTRRDGSSVYTVAGSQLYSSTRVLTAEERLVRHASTTGGSRIAADQVDLALVEVAANGLTLNAGQAAMVRAMTTSGDRLQLAIAPAGSGKTTAMSTVAQAWTGAGGTILGLAPSAAAAAALRDQTGTTTDTLAKLTWALQHNQPLPAWAADIGPRHLVIIDEAGMADTLSLATVADYVISRGASVRLIGDTQQLAAIGAGGVLRDIEATCGALRLTQIVRFSDPVEAAASLALRDGALEALGFYLDRDRVHVGDPATIIDGVFAAWSHDQEAGRDAVMLAATRDLANDLNARAQAQAQAHRHAPTGSEQVALAGGSRAHVGDVIITRRNDRSLRTTATDFVKNGDRWDVAGIGADGSLAVTHRGTHRRVTLPADYVAAWVDLGYASTINTAQGITADISHTVLTGTESRQQAYTAMTRGRHGNHVHLQIVGAGEEHSVIHPSTTHPSVPAEILAALLARDDTPLSVHTHIRLRDDPRTHLADAANRYLDALHVAAEQLTPPGTATVLDQRADDIVPGLIAAPAWPTLRAQLLLVHACGGPEPVLALATAAAGGELGDAHDPAAVLHWRIATHALRDAGKGPLPWLPAVPSALATHPEWGPYLRERAARVTDLAAASTQSSPRTPDWVRHRAVTPHADLIDAIQLWRIATGVPDADLRPTGPRQLLGPAARYQSRLDAALAAVDTPALDEWLPLLTRIAPTIGRDPFVLDLAERLAATARAGLDAPAILHAATVDRPALPDDHCAAALWWRLHGQLSPITLTTTSNSEAQTASGPDLVEHFGADRAAALQSDPSWPALAGALTRATARGWTLSDLLPSGSIHPGNDSRLDLSADELLWRVSVVLDPLPAADDDPHPELADLLPPDDIDDLPVAGAAEVTLDAPDLVDADEPVALEQVRPEPEPEVGIDLASLWSTALLRRELREPLELTEREINAQLERAFELDHADIPPERLFQLNTQALHFFQSRYPDSWSQHYLTERFGINLAGHPQLRPGHSPDDWNSLTTHLMRRGATEEELLAADLSTRARTGRLIDRFRDRVVFPITDEGGHVLGFVGRRHPEAADHSGRGPKYLNTAATLIYRKGEQLYIAGDSNQLRAGATGVWVEGPMDAIAVTLATRGTHVGVAALGTSLTAQQARQLAQWGRTPIIATDNDPAGRQAADRGYWRLTPHGLDPLQVTLPPGQDPAALYRLGPEFLSRALVAATPLATNLLEALPDGQDLDRAAALDIIAARPTHHWAQGLDDLARKSGVDADELVRHLAIVGNRWSAAPLVEAERRLATPHTDVLSRDEPSNPPSPRRPADHPRGHYRQTPGPRRPR